MNVGNFTNDRQSQTTAFRTVTQQAVEAFEDTFALFARNTRAVIGDKQPWPAIIENADRDPPVTWRVAHGIVDEIVEQFLEA